MFRIERGDVGRLGPWLVLMAVVFLAAHLAELPKTLEDLDSINFAMGVRDFDVARHQPHPPGYPIYIALAKASTKVFHATGLAAAEPRGLAVWGAIGGALAVFPLFTCFRRIDACGGIAGRDRRAILATVATVAAPLYWFTASRPLSDMTGLAAVLAAQALSLSAWARLRDPAADRVAAVRRLIAAAAVAGLAIGIRSQTFVLTLPILGLVLADRRVPAARRATVGAIGAFLGGVLVWGVPLVLASGGLRAYLAALGNQGGEDFSGVAMLWTALVGRDAHLKAQAAYALRDTFVLPWATIALARVVLTLAVAGAAVLAWRARAALIVVAAAVVPYAAFHLLFQETATVRYALPIVPLTAYLAVVAIDALATAVSRRQPSLSAALATSVVVAIVVGSLWTAAPALSSYAAAGSPVFRAIADIDARARATGLRPAIAGHWDAKRAEEWAGGDLPGPLLRVERGHEWLAAVQYWLAGGRDPVWFLARPGRTDLALFDPAHRVLAGQYRWDFDTRVFTGGARPNGVDWYDLSSPGWFLDRGWAITPETAGVAHADGVGPEVRPSLGYLARRPDEALLMIGGRHLGGPADPPVRITVDIDGRAVLDWEQMPGYFLRFQSLAAGALAGTGAFARLSVRSSNAGRPIPVGLEQFDLQSAGAVVWGFDDGWMEPEHDPAKGLSWRWTLARSTLNVHGAGRDVTIRMSGESPMKNGFDRPPHVTVTAGGQPIATFSPDRDFVEEFTVPAAVLAAAHGLVVMETDRTFSPPNGDPRTLGLRVYGVTVR